MITIIVSAVVMACFVVRCLVILGNHGLCFREFVCCLLGLSFDGEAEIPEIHQPHQPFESISFYSVRDQTPKEAATAPSVMKAFHNEVARTHILWANVYMRIATSFRSVESDWLCQPTIDFMPGACIRNLSLHVFVIVHGQSTESTISHLSNMICSFPRPQGLSLTVNVDMGPKAMDREQEVRTATVVKFHNALLPGLLWGLHRAGKGFLSKACIRFIGLGSRTYKSSADKVAVYENLAWRIILTEDEGTTISESILKDFGTKACTNSSSA